MRRVRAVRKLTAALLALAAAWLAGAGAAAAPRYLSLHEAWALAEEHHPRMVEARRNLAALERELQQRENAYAPAVNLSIGGLSASVDPEGDWRWPSPSASLSASVKLPAGVTITLQATSPSLSSPSSSNNWRGSVQVQYPLFRSPELDGDAQALRQARQSLEAARRELEQRRDEVRAAVLAAMQAEQIAAARLRLAEAAYADAVASWELAQRQMALGIMTEAEYLAAQVDLLRAEQERLSAERAWQARRRELGDMLGLDDAFAYEFEDVLAVTAMPDPGDPEAAVERAVANSLTVWERRQSVETAEMQLAAERERSGLTAQLSATYTPRGAVDEQGPPNSQTPSRSVFRVDVSISYPLYDAGQRRLALQAREEAVERAREQLAQAEQDVRSRVADLFVQLEDARRDVEIASLDLRRAELEMAAVLRQAGLAVAAAGQDDVERTRRNVVRAELSYLEAVQRYQARWIELQRLQGPVPWEQLLGAAAGGEVWR